uniref:Zinc finger, CCHC-type n=1 Tax=Tanacetum cinerariifolium TaxID=118510 RepID=A0A699HFB3_TANCI|nr:zinc finger, CCHC-type [Tanacetum cinerariifolium]
MASMNTRLNIKKLDGNIVQKHGGSKQVGLKQLGSKQVGFKQVGVKQVGFKQLGPGVEIGVHGVHDEKRVWFEVLHGFEFEVEPLGDHTSEVEPQENVDQRAGLQEVQTQDLMDYQLARDRKQHIACELFGYREDSTKVISKWKTGLKDDMDARSDVYVLSNGCRKSSNDNHDYYWGYTPDKAKGNVLGMEIVRDESGYTLRVSKSRLYNRKLVYNLLEVQFILLLEGSLSWECDVEKNASAGVDMLDEFDRGLQTNIHVFMDFDYAMRRSITVMSRSITRYGLMILGCAGSLKANLKHIEALSTTEVGYMTFTKAWKKEIWLKGLLTESGYELSLIAGIAIGALVKGSSRSEVPAQVKVVAYRY